MSDFQTEKYTSMANEATKDTRLRNALHGLQDRFCTGALNAYQAMPEGPEIRYAASDIRTRTMENLDLVLATLADNIRARGGHVYFAENAEDAVRYTREVAAKHNVRSVVKGKSMLTEEIGLNDALQADGIEVTETDLGEYIIQLAGQKPSHIIAPAVHLDRHQIADLFEDRLRIERTEEPTELTRAARKALREKFLQADMGISGGNMACAETGQVAIVSNEGNIRMATTLPKVHVAMLGMEKVAATLADHRFLLRLLTRGAAAQNMSTYVSYVGGPRGEDEVDGPEEFHLVIVDNGRMRILADPEFREVLNCIRCGGCLNACPVYLNIGGHAYGFPYSGPIGAVVAPLLHGVNKAKDLCQGESLCGACKDICPVNNDLPRMLLALRRQLAYGDKKWDVQPASKGMLFGFKAFATLTRSRFLFNLALKAGSLGMKLLPKRKGMVRLLPPPFGGWTHGRDIRPVADEPFARRWKRLQKELPGLDTKPGKAD